MVLDPISWIVIGSIAGFGAVNKTSRMLEEEGYGGDNANLARHGKRKPMVHRGGFWQEDDGQLELRPAARQSTPPRQAMRPAPRQEEYAPPRQSAPRRGGGEVVIPAGRGGHYILNCSINGVRFEGALDTGATQVTLTAKTFKAITGEPISKFKANGRCQTANGLINTTNLPMAVTVEGITFDDVEVSITHGGGCVHNLIGNSFISRLSEMTFRDGQLIMRR
jgi:clan AA aspartic protease (TIGR02281 family)